MTDSFYSFIPILRNLKNLSIHTRADSRIADYLLVPPPPHTSSQHDSSIVMTEDVLLVPKDSVSSSPDTQLLLEESGELVFLSDLFNTDSNEFQQYLEETPGSYESPVEYDIVTETINEEDDEFSDNDSVQMSENTHDHIGYVIPAFPFHVYSPDITQSLATLVIRLKIILLIFANVTSMDAYFVTYHLVMQLISLPNDTEITLPSSPISDISDTDDNQSWTTCSSSSISSISSISNSMYEKEDTDLVFDLQSLNEIYEYDFTFFTRNVLQLIVISCCMLAEKYIGIDANDDYRLVTWQLDKLDFSVHEYVYWEARILCFLDFCLPLPCDIPEIQFYETHRWLADHGIKSIDIYTSLLDPIYYNGEFLLNILRRFEDDTFQLYRSFFRNPYVIKAHKYMYLEEDEYDESTYNWQRYFPITKRKREDDDNENDSTTETPSKKSKSNNNTSRVLPHFGLLKMPTSVLPHLPLRTFHTNRGERSIRFILSTKASNNSTSTTNNPPDRKALLEEIEEKLAQLNYHRDIIRGYVVPLT